MNILNFGGPKKEKEPKKSASGNTGENTGTDLVGAGTLAPANTAPAIFEAGTGDFEQSVMAASMETPILVDFWAPWCGPCKQLMPILKEAVDNAQGAVRMATVNIDEHPELAQALQVKSVPTVFAFFQGQPVTAFQGLKSPAEIKRMIDEMIKMAKQAAPDAIDIPQALQDAATALAEKRIEAAQQIYMNILEQDERNGAAYAGIIRSFIVTEDFEQASAMIEGASDEIAKSDDLKAAKTALDLAMNSTKVDIAPLQKAVDDKPKDQQARFDLAEGLFAAGQKEEAIDQLIEMIRQNREWEEEKARKQLLTYFEAIGHGDPITMAGRRKLSTVLFS